MLTAKSYRQKSETPTSRLKTLKVVLNFFEILCGEKRRNSSPIQKTEILEAIGSVLRTVRTVNHKGKVNR